MPFLFFYGFSRSHGSLRRLENRFQGDLAVLQDFEVTLPFAKSGGSKYHTVISRGEFQSCRSISHELVVHVDFRIFRIGRYRNRAESVRWLARKGPRRTAVRLGAGRGCARVDRGLAISRNCCESGGITAFAGRSFTRDSGTGRNSQGIAPAAVSVSNHWIKPLQHFEKIRCA